MINEVITYLTFIPWMMIFVKNSLDKISNKDRLSFKYIKSNFFKIFRIDLLILIIVFFYFAKFDKDFVHKYLFAVINIYLFVNSFYESNNIDKKILKKRFMSLLIIGLIISIPIIYYILSNNLIVTYMIMFICLYLENIIILVMKKIKK